MADLTHWKKLHNPDYLGAYSLEPGKDLIVTIKSVKQDDVAGTDGKKEKCMVIRFEENGVKPMIMNATNAKTITKILGTPFVEKWSGQKIQLYAAEIKAFGEVVEALRVRNYKPKSETPKLLCFDCDGEIIGIGKKSAQEIADYTKAHYENQLCGDCASVRSKALAEEKEKEKEIKENDTNERELPQQGS